MATTVNDTCYRDLGIIDVAKLFEDLLFPTRRRRFRNALEGEKILFMGKRFVWAWFRQTCICSYMRRRYKIKFAEGCRATPRTPRTELQTDVAPMLWFADCQNSTTFKLAPPGMRGSLGLLYQTPGSCFSTNSSRSVDCDRSKRFLFR